MVLQFFFPQFAKHDDVTDPIPIIYSHVAIKGTQVGLYAGVVFPIVQTIFDQLRGSTTARAPYLQRAVGAFPFCIAGCIAISCGMAYYRTTYKSEKNKQRGYLILNSQQQQRSDNLTFAGFAAGTVAAAVTQQSLAAGFFYGGFVFGLVNFGLNMKDKYDP